MITPLMTDEELEEYVERIENLACNVHTLKVRRSFMLILRNFVRENPDARDWASAVVAVVVRRTNNA